MCKIMEDIKNQGIEQGIEQGIKQGVEQGIKQGVEQGIKQGVEQGIEKGKKEFVINLFNDGTTDILKISKLVGMPKEKVEEILKQK